MTDFEVDDGWRSRKMMMSNDDLTDLNTRCAISHVPCSTRVEQGTWIWLRKWSWVRNIVSMLYPHPYVQVLQKGHPDSVVYNLVSFPLTHTHKLKTLSASSVVAYLTTDNKKKSVFQPLGSGCKGKPLIWPRAKCQLHHTQLLILFTNATAKFCYRYTPAHLKIAHHFLLLSLRREKN